MVIIKVTGGGGCGDMTDGGGCVDNKSDRCDRWWWLW